VVQGYLVGKPMPVASLARWYKEWDARVQNGELFAKVAANQKHNGADQGLPDQRQANRAISEALPLSNAKPSPGGAKADRSLRVSEES
jgi:hypothetical protein